MRRQAKTGADSVDMIAEQIKCNTNRCFQFRNGLRMGFAIPDSNSLGGSVDLGRSMTAPEALPVLSLDPGQAMHATLHRMRRDPEEHHDPDTTRTR